MTAADRANFADRVLPRHEARAVEIAAKLCGVLGELAAFAADHQLVPENQVLVDASGARLHQIVVARRGLPAAGRSRGLPPSDTFETRRLWGFIEQHLPDLDPRVRDASGKVIMVATPASARRPAWFAFLERQPDGWLVSKRGRVAGLLRGSSYWRALGLRAPASPRLLACASLLIDGELPAIDLSKSGVTVAEVIEREEAAIRAHVHAHAQRRRKRRNSTSR